MDIEKIKQAFAPKRKAAAGIERHSIKSLGKRVLLSRQTIRLMLKSGELKPSQCFSAGKRAQFEFSAAHLDTVREEVVSAIIGEIQARLKNLNCDEQEAVLAALHGLRAQKADCEIEFSKPDDDDDVDLAKILGITGGGLAGAVVGGKLGGTAGAIAGGGAGALTGDKAPAAALTGAGLIAGDALIRNAGGYRAVGGKLAGLADEGVSVIGGRMKAAVARALARAAKAAA